jgi:hypothetical protein
MGLTHSDRGTSKIHRILGVRRGRRRCLKRRLVPHGELDRITHRIFVYQTMQDGGGADGS